MKNVAIIGGVRTPFVKAAGKFARLKAFDLASIVIEGIVSKVKVDPSRIDEVIFSSVLLDPRIPNLARELIVRSKLPATINAHFISNNCISGLVAATFLADGIKTGRVSCGIAGGVESMSRPTLSLSSAGENFFISLSRSKSLAQKLKILSSFRPGFLVPIPPSPREPSTGLTMGQHCEQTVKELTIGRKEQDEIAFRSHERASVAQKEGVLAKDIVSVNGVDADDLIRSDTNLEKLGKLSPVFDRSETGTITAGNSSALTDGASAVFLMDADIAKVEGREILGIIEAVEFAAIEPKAGLLMAPAFAVPKLLQKVKLALKDIDVFEIHEAFGGQVATNLKAWREGWSKFPELKTIGEIPKDKINILGGSIALGHPFAATGGRLILSACRALEKVQGRTALISVCAAGGMGCAMLVRRA